MSQKKHNILFSPALDFSKPLSTAGEPAISDAGKPAILFKAGELALARNDIMALILGTGLSASLNKFADQISEPIKLTVGKVEYTPPKKQLFKWSLKALLKPKLFFRTLPKPAAKEMQRVIGEGQQKVAYSPEFLLGARKAAVKRLQLGVNTPKEISHRLGQATLFGQAAQKKLFARGHTRLEFLRKYKEIPGKRYYPAR